MLEEIKERVQKKVQQNHNKIILSYFQTLINRHIYSNSCNCNYCEKCRYYIQLKLYKHNFMKRYFCYEQWEEVDMSLEREYYNNYGTLDNKIKDLKIEKDNLKKLELL